MKINSRPAAPPRTSAQEVEARIRETFPKLASVDRDLLNAIFFGVILSTPGVTRARIGVTALGGGTRVYAMFERDGANHEIDLKLP